MILRALATWSTSVSPRVLTLWQEGREARGIATGWANERVFGHGLSGRAEGHGHSWADGRRAWVIRTWT